MKRFLLLSIFISFFFTNTAQIDTSFWFAVPAITPDGWWKDDVKLQLSAFSSSATVRVYQPAFNSANKYDTTFVVPANSTFQYTLWRFKLASPLSLGYDSLEVRPTNSVVPYGLKISSSAKISAVCNLESRGPNFFNPETFSLKGKNALGTSFICPFETMGINQAVFGDLNGDGITTQPKQKISIIASQANTTIFITPKCSIIGYSANVTYSVLLVKSGDCYAIENALQATNTITNNLSGTEITSNKPIAVTMSNDSYKSTAGGCYDLTGDQLVPINKTGLNYALLTNSTFTNASAGAYLVATQNNTQININDGAVITSTTINKGVTFYYNLTQATASISCSLPTYCLRVTGFGCELGDEILTPINCAGSKDLFFSRSTQQQFELNIICPNTIQTTFTLTNASNVVIPLTGLTFTTIAGSNTLTSPYYVGTRINLSSISTLPIGSYKLSNSAGIFWLGIIEGGSATGATFHQASSFTGDTEISIPNPVAAVCVGQTNTIALSGIVGGSAPFGTWSTANGTGTFSTYSSTLTNIATTYSLSTADQSLTSIKFYLTSSGGCLPIKDSMVVAVNQAPILFPPPFIGPCVGQPTVNLYANSLSNAGNVSWAGGTGAYSSTTGTNNITYTISILDINTPPIFTLTTQQPLLGCSNITKTVQLIFMTGGLVGAAASPSIICPGQQVLLQGYAANGFTSFFWLHGGPSSQSVSPGTTTSYTFSAQFNNGCSSQAVTTVSVISCLSLDELTNQNSISIYPNPSSHLFYLKGISLSEKTNYTVYSSTGQLLFSKPCMSSQTVIDLSEYAAGIYFIRIQTDLEKPHVVKLIKN
jgi:hypothetical protein